MPCRRGGAGVAFDPNRTSTGLPVSLFDQYDAATDSGGSMMRRALIGIALLALSHLAFANASSVLAQAGSVGGTIGNQDKTISGGEQQRSSHPQAGISQPANREKTKGESSPKIIQLNEHAFGMTWSVTLHNVGGNSYQGTWSHGYVTKFAVTALTNTSIKMQRVDNPKFGAVSGSYTGSRTGNTATGEATESNGSTTKWDASW